MSTESDHGFYIAIAAEVEEDDLVADLVYRGEHVAAIQRIDGRWALTLYEPAQGGELRLPFREFLAALEEAAERLDA